jgi:pimeloyl-ACP methyl ester carboxylesterase
VSFEVHPGEVRRSEPRLPYAVERRFVSLGCAVTVQPRRTVHDRMRFTDFIVVLPGIGGSVLTSTAGPVWEPTLGMAGALLARHGEVLERIAGDPNLLADNDYDDGIRATRLIETPVTLPGLTKLNHYKKLRQAITRSFDVTPSDPTSDGAPANYFEFPYDWRRDNRRSAALLAELVNRELPKWNATLPYGNAKVVFVCHSMGGLVAKYYLDVLDGWRSCRALITFGTPFRGSVKALDLLANGYRKCGIHVQAMSRLIAGFPSVHQLLPRYPVVWTTKGQLPLRPAELTHDVGGLRPDLAKSAYEDFHRRMDSSGHSTRIWAVVGYGQETCQSALLQGTTLRTSTDWHTTNPNQQSLGTGDGTVPAVSAIPVELSDTGPRNWVNSTHSSMVSADPGLTHLIQSLAVFDAGLKDLQQPISSAPDGHTPPAGPALDVGTQDVYQAGDHIQIEVTGAARPPQAQISSNGRPVDCPVHESAQVEQDRAGTAGLLRPQHTGRRHVRHDGTTARFRLRRAHRKSPGTRSRDIRTPLRPEHLL